MGSPPLKLSPEDGSKIGKGAVIAAGGAIIGYLIKQNFAELPAEIEAAVFVIACALVNLVWKWLTDTRCSS